MKSKTCSTVLAWQHSSTAAPPRIHLPACLPACLFLQTAKTAEELELEQLQAELAM